VRPCKSLRRPALIEAMTTDIPEPAPLYERFLVAYSATGTVIRSFYCGGVTLIASWRVTIQEPGGRIVEVIPRRLVMAAWQTTAPENLACHLPR
jgi:hypothetical protein